MLVVADTSALIAIATCNGLEWLETLFTEIQVPQAVYDEAVAEGKPQSHRLKRYLMNRVVQINLDDYVITTPKLGKGELEAMALYKHQHAQRLLIDDLQARKTASYNGIKIIGSIGVLILAKESGLISLIKPHLSQIQKSDIHISQSLVNEALKIAREV